MAYFKTLREKLTDAEREAWKESWKRKSAPWNRKRGFVEEAREPQSKKIRARKSKGYRFKMMRDFNLFIDKKITTSCISLENATKNERRLLSRLT